MNDFVLELNDLNVSLAGRQVLTDVSFSVRRGECLGLVGESGSGKSVTCRAIIGLLGRIGGTVLGGKISMGPVDLLGLNARQWQSIRGRRIAFVPQNSLSSLNPLMRVGAQLRETIRFLEPAADARLRSRELLESVQMAQIDFVLQAYPHQLSGGMRQRVMIALALAGDPELLVADEPTTALDATIQREILDLISEIRHERGLSVILVTHDMATVFEVCDSIAVMCGGRLVEAGDVRSVLEAPAHPYTRGLLASTPALNHGSLAEPINNHSHETRIETYEASA